MSASLGLYRLQLVDSHMDEIRARLGSDPWTVNDLLRISEITRWTLRLGALE